MSRSLRPFHLAFPVHCLKRTKEFYCTILQCPEGRSTNKWLDFSFFGNQLSAHLVSQEEFNASQHLKWQSEVDGKAVPLYHFGAIVEWDQFNELASRLHENGIEFVIEPQVRYPGKKGEQKTMFFKDFTGNAIELKAFRDEDEVFEKQ